jgi:hypothetical protein
LDLVLSFHFQSGCARRLRKARSPGHFRRRRALPARANAAKAYEAGIAQRVVLIEFDSVERAVAAHESEGYQAALKVFGKAAERDLRIVEGLA